MSDVVIVDSGIANLASVSAAFSRLGAAVSVSSDPALVAGASRLVLPGVGAFGAAVESLRSKGLDTAIRSAIASGSPVLAICLGMQVLTEGSEESPGVHGLGVIPGTCRRLPDESRVPHLGWNVVRPDSSSGVVKTMDAAFANSFALREAPAGWNAGWTTHGVRFVSSIERGHVVGCQFHPELSGAAGQELLRRWLTGKSAECPEPTRRDALAARIVPCLDIRDGRVVKGVKFANLRDSGDPAEQAARYEAQGADEIVVLDITASVSNRETQLATMRSVRACLGIPLTAGGGVRSVEDARRLLAAGADKVSVNTAAVARPTLIAELAREFGTQCVVLAIDARRANGSWEVLTHGGREVAFCLDAVAWAERGVASGAGEILLTSWDRDGTRAGCDLELLRAVSSAVRVPVIASGGIGTRADVFDAIEAGADAVLAASVLHDGDDTVFGIKTELATRGLAVRL
jgi:imidazole glycerol phosphate synthase glutamine amidotransferase subunit